MENVPNIVRERLKATTSAVGDATSDHPDADVLTAFAERLLPALERENVLDHISRCEECREVLALALPASEELQVVLRPSPAGARGWLTWPALRWGFVAAGIALIGSLGVVQYQRSQMNAPTAASHANAKNAKSDSMQNEVAAIEAQTAPVPPPAVSSSAGSPTGAAENRSRANARADLDRPASADSFAYGLKDKSSNEVTLEPTLEPKGGATVHVPQSTGGIAGAVGGPMMTLSQQQAQSQVPLNGRAFAPLPLSPAKQQAQLASASAAPAAATTETVEVQSENGQPSTEKPSDLPKQNGSADRPSVNYSESGVGKAKLPVASQTANGLPAENAVPPLPLQTQPSLMRAFAAPVPRWTIGSSGNLQRSYDAGKSWQNVEVNPASSFISPSGVTGGNVADAKREKDAATKALKRDAMPAGATIFRAVTASGADVWAGGSSGALYHSLDAGAHWSLVIPASAGAVLTGDIMALQFSDALHGKVITSTSETWITSDDGQTWQRQ